MNDQQRAAMIRPRGKSVFPQMVAAYRAMQMALEALEFADNKSGYYSYSEEITALREALAQPQVSDYDREFWVDGQPQGDDKSQNAPPEGFGTKDKDELLQIEVKRLKQLMAAEKKPQSGWVDLTDDEILTAANVSQEDIDDLDLSNVLSDVRAIIAKFKEKNTPPVVPQGKQQDVSQIEAMVNLHDAAFVRGFAAGKLYGQANPEPQEPMAWMLEQGDVVEFEYRDYHENSEWTPLYTAPPSVEAAIEATKEKAAKVCESFEWEEFSDGLDCAAAIRSMK